MNRKQQQYLWSLWARAACPRAVGNAGLWAISIDRQRRERVPALRVFLGDPRVPLDNNPAERTLRGVVVGRKNHYGSKSVRGTEVAAIFYSLIESAALAGIEPKRYLLTAVENVLRDPGTITLPRDLIEVADSGSTD